MNKEWKSISEILKNISDFEIFESEEKQNSRKDFNENLKKIKKYKPEQDEFIFLEKSGLIIENIFLDSRKITKNTDLFFATKGVNINRADFVDNVMENGCLNIVCSEIPKNIKNNLKNIKYKNVTFVVVKDLEKKVGKMAENFYDNPSEKIKIIGITGTNGKTTIVTSLFSILKKMNQRVAMFSTIKNIIGDKEYETENTTPDPISISEKLKEAVDKKCNFAVMEVSSHALEQGRVSAIDFDGAVFTNLTQDHLDYHKDMNNYFLAKKIFFDSLKKDAIAVSNFDDQYGAKILDNTKASRFSYAAFDNNFLKIYNDKNIINTYFFNNKKIIQNKTEIQFSNKKNDRRLKINLIGDFNIYNMLAVYTILSEIGFDKNLILKLIEDIEAPKGRMEIVAKNNSKKVLAIVDYAHTPDALDNVLKSVSLIKEEINTNLKEGDRKKRIILVVGAGGDRDKGKRPLMGKIAVEKSDFVFFTSDNPRTENANEILNDIIKEIDKSNKNFEVIENRSESIAKAIEFSKEGDILIVAGKGHEEYQIIGIEKKYFSDKDEIEKKLI